MKNRIAVIGGGAAGIMSAIVAANNGGEVLILERNDRVGKKLLATGNGRCNYTNIHSNINNFHGKDYKFADYALNNFDVDTTIEFFDKLGITPANLSILKTGKAKGMRFDTLEAICNVLDCQPGDLLEYVAEE